MKKKVWFVTGASKGLGLALVKKLLAAGNNVAATSRTVKSLEQSIGAKSSQFLPLNMDLLDEKDVARALRETNDHFGQLDVIVNNAGYGMVGAVEELTDREARENFDVNVFGSLNVIRQSLPYLRARKGGHIFNIASIGGFTGAFPGFGIYCATKFAMHGFSESLAFELKPFDINVTVVSPGYFRTEFLDASLAVPQNQMQEYQNVRQVQDQHTQDINHSQAGDPDKAADVMIQVADMKKPPLHLFLGRDSYQLAAEKISAIEADMERVHALATSTGFEEVFA